MQRAVQGLARAIGDQDFGMRIQRLVFLGMREERGEELRELLPQQGMPEEQGVLVVPLFGRPVQILYQEGWRVKPRSPVGQVDGRVLLRQLVELRPYGKLIA